MALYCRLVCPGLICLDTSGNFLWRYEFPGIVWDINKILIAQGGNILAAGSKDTLIYYLDKHGNLVWKKSLEGKPLWKCINVPKTPIFINNDKNGKLMILSLDENRRALLFSTLDNI